MTVEAGTYDGTITGSLIKIGGGTLSLGSVPSFDLDVSSGTATITQSATGHYVDVGPGGVLDVTAFPQFTARAAHLSGGSVLGNLAIVAPADGALHVTDNKIDTAEVTGAVTISGSSPSGGEPVQLLFDVDGQKELSDVLKLDGGLAVQSNTLITLVGSNIVPGEVFEIIDYASSFSGSLNVVGGLNINPLQAFPKLTVTLVNDSADHTIEAIISAVPEPAVGAIMMISILVHCGRRRERRC